MNQERPMVNEEKLRAFVRTVLRSAGAAEEAAFAVADSLVLADARGVSSHGVSMLRHYVELIRDGHADPRAEPVLEVDSGPVLRFDARHGLGIAAARKAVEAAIARARSLGACIAAVRNSTHFGMAAYYTLKAAEEGMVCIAMSGANPQVAPWGAAERFFGTNPLSVGIPSAEEPAFNLDMATSVAAAGKIGIAYRRGEPIPDDWAIGPDGNRTTDPLAALSGALLPFGGAKGSAIGLMIDLFCNGLVGRNDGQGARPQSLGHLFVVIDPVALGASDFPGFVAARLAALRGLKPAPGFDRVYSPGEIEYRKLERSRAEGIPLEPSVYDDIVALGREWGVAADLH